MSPNEVLIIGDSFFGMSHQVTAFLEDLARSTGALPVGERYRDHSSVVDNVLAFGGVYGIAAQYEGAFAEVPPAVVILNGGGADIWLGTCEPLTAECPAIADAEAAMGALLSQMAEQGVVAAIYAFYPDPTDANLRAKMDILRLVMEDVCQASSICHWLDLRSTFANHEDYLEPDIGVIPTAAGAEASARVIWTMMEERCIAQ